MNKVNPRKEFFRATVADLKTEFDAMNVQGTWTVTAMAAQYRETQAIEERLQSDPSARRQWIDTQMVLDPVDSGGKSAPEMEEVA